MVASRPRAMPGPSRAISRSVGIYPENAFFCDTQKMHFCHNWQRGKPRFCGAGMAPRVPLALAANKSESEPFPQVPRNALGRFYRTARRFKLRLRRKLRNSNRTEISENPKFIYENLRIFMRAISGTSPRLPCAFVPGPLPMGHVNLLAQLLFLGMFCALKFRTEKHETKFIYAALVI